MRWNMGERTAAATALWWAVENLCIWAPCFVAAALFPVPPATATFLEQWRWYCLTGATTIEGGFLLQHILVHSVFAETPRFPTGGTAHPRDGWHTGMVDFARVMLPSLSAGSLVFTALVRCLSNDPLLEVRTLSAQHSVRPGPFLLRLLLTRLIVDVFFYAVHRVSGESRFDYTVFI